ncbi:hypothetical protein AX769_19965 [Frondihabitans sp. PAMC 28766]|uniref:hypothetical protein n=1 Tax=Frondihabitans sp. PAMC 28766 TaxID=1795630 RepID=UPI00078CACB7|nr:hypothetical protein [Frondihabitans sp. PAMC 28766]AMM22007.1 hypothetical protein AX769_19965 [Frondihabitans sp. PAMC 28766]
MYSIVPLMVVAGALSGWGENLSLRVGYEIDFRVPASLVLPLTAACLASGLILDPAGPIAAISTRPLRRLLAARLVLCLCSFTLGLAGALTVMEAPDAAIALALRNEVLLLGIILGSIGFLDLALAWIPPSAYAIICMLAGVGADGSRHPWAVLLEQDIHCAAAWASAFAVAVIGLSITMIRLRTRQARH